VTLQKDNYELRTALISFTVNIRIFNVELDATELDDDLITVVHGEDIEFEVTLIDTTRGIPLTGALVEIEIGDETYDMKEDTPGVYKYTFETDDVDAFFTSKTYTVTITITKAYFAEDEIELTIEVTMEEIFDGMPTFYFIMILSSICAAIGSIVGYRVIHQARIPIFVKKVVKVRKAIKSQSKVPKIAVDSRKLALVKDVGKKWRDIGLSLNKVLGIEEKESLDSFKAKNSSIQKGGAK